MIKLKLGLLILASIFIFACGNTENNNKEKADNSENNTEIKTEIVEEAVNELQKYLTAK